MQEAAKNMVDATNANRLNFCVSCVKAWASISESEIIY
jgi:hypothetical protein